MTAVILTAALVLTGITFGAAPPAQAALHNVFPADHNGFPKDRFFANEALFVTFTSDFGGSIFDQGGGRICIVSPDSTDPASMNCDSHAVWGGISPFIGIGSMIGLPLTGTGLTPGTWLLLADHGIPDPKNPTKIIYEGTSLSQPFTVLSCKEGCAPFDGQAVLQAWKDRALPLSAGHTALSGGADARALKSVVNAGRGMYALAGGGLLGMTLGFAAGAFTYFVDTDTEGLALSKLKNLSTQVSDMYMSIYADPPRFDYTTPTVPVFAEYPATGDALWDEYFEHLTAVEAYGLASRIAYERFQGAQLDGDTASAVMQARATAELTFDMVRHMRQLEIIQPQIAALPEMQGPLMTADDFDLALAERARIFEEGHTPEQRQELLDAGLSEATIDEIRQEYGDPAFAATDITTSLADHLNDITDLLPDIIDDYDLFGRYLAIEASEIEKTLPVPPGNRAPISSFEVSATTGVAPLTVTFTSTAYDPDGDPLDLRWDIAGVHHVEGEEQITYTFDSPGNYGVSLVADDGEEWHQSVLWVSVYPVGDDPSDNRPPVARFTPTFVDREGPVTQTFTSLSFDPDDDDLTHTWYFGDGVRMEGESVTRSFDAGFIYSVLLVVSDGSLTGQTAGEVTSRHAGGGLPDNEPPEVSFAASATSGTAPFDVDFTSTSVDPDGDPLTHTWYFGDGTTETGESVSHRYEYPGSFTVTLVVSDGQATRIATQQIEVAPVPRVMQAGFSVSTAYDAAKLAQGARIFEVSSEQNSTTAAGSNVVAPTGRWWTTATGAVTDERIVLHLAGDGRDLLDSIRMTADGTTSSPRTFSLELSSDDVPWGDYRTVIDRAEMTRSNNAQEFAFDAQTARFARITLHDNHGANTIRLQEIGLPTVERAGGLVSLPQGVPARIVDVSSEAFNNAAINALRPTTTRWQTPNGQPIDEQFLRIALAGEGSHQIDAIALRGSTGPGSLRGFELLLSDDGTTWTTVLTDELPWDDVLHEFSFTPQQARFAELRPLSSHSGGYVGVREWQVLTQHGMNVADPEGGGATITALSSEQSGQLARNVLDTASNRTWRSAAGQHTNQQLTVLLRNGEVATVDRVGLRSELNNARPSNVEVWVSATGQEAGDFVKVAERQLLNHSTVQWLEFDPVDARYVQVRFIDSYSTNYISVRDLMVSATSRGGATAVPFIDRSTPGEHDIVAWTWDFGHPGGTSSAQHPVHTFPGPGTYPIMLTVTDADGAERTSTGTYTVPAMPQISISSETTTVDEGEAVQLSAASDGGVSIVEWEWDLDYTQPTTTNPSTSARFPDQGEYTVSVRGRTADDLWTPAATRTFTVLNVPPTAALADFTMTAQNVFTPPNTAHVNDVSADMPLLCTIDWGDGSSTVIEDCRSTTLRQASHAYDVAGDYEVTLTADDRDGGITTAQATYTALHRPTLLQVVDTAEVDDELAATVRLVDALHGAPISAPVTVDGAGASATETTDADGWATLRLPVEADLFEVAFAGNTVYAPNNFERDVRVPAADLVFIIDESTSMGAYIAHVRDRIGEIAAGLGPHLDYRLGLVSMRGGQGTVVEDHAPVLTALPDGLPQFVEGVNVLSWNFGGQINGFTGIVAASDDQMGFREEAAACLVLVSDASFDETEAVTSPSTTKDDALAAMQARDATLFSIILRNHQQTIAAFGTGSGLAGLSGGDSWPVNDFSADASAVLESLVTQCVTIAHTPDVSIEKTSASDVVAPNEAVEYTLTVRNEAALDVTGVMVTDTLPAGAEVVSISDGGTVSNGTVTWPLFELAAAQDAVRTITLRLPGSGLTAGDHERVNVAAVSIATIHGEESDTDNNTDSHTVTLRVPDEPSPEVHDVGIVTSVDASQAVSAGDTFTYRLAVTNHGDAAAGDVRISDVIPGRFEVMQVDAPGWSNPAGSDLVFRADDGSGDAMLRLTLETLAPEASSDVVVTLRVLPLEQPLVVTDAGPLDAELPPLAANPVSQHGWQACVIAELDEVSENDCDSVSVSMADVVGQVSVRLADGGAFLIMSVATTDALGEGPVTLRWTPLADGQPATASPAEVVITDLLPGEQRVIPWPGLEVSEAGAVTSWPGWRAITDEDRTAGGDLLHPVTGDPMTEEDSDAMVRGDLMLDPTAGDYAWRFTSSLIFETGASAIFTVEYREQLPVIDPEPENPGVEVPIDEEPSPGDPAPDPVTPTDPNEPSDPPEPVAPEDSETPVASPPGAQEPNVSDPGLPHTGTSVELSALWLMLLLGVLGIAGLRRRSNHRTGASLS